MKLLFRQRLFSWFDSYDIYDEAGQPVFTVQGQLSWGHCLHVMDATGAHVGTVKEVVFTFLPKFELYTGDRYFGCVRKEFSFLRPRYDLDCNGWHVEGNWMEWDYQITDGMGYPVAVISKQLLHWTDTYTIEVHDPADALGALMIVLAIDAEKCSRN